MPCMRCSNGKYKYGVHGNCQFDTLDKCEAAAAAIHINNPTSKETVMDSKKPKKKPPLSTIVSAPGPHGPIPEPNPGTPQIVAPVGNSNKEYGHPASCECPACIGYGAGDAYNPELDRSTHYN